MTPILTDQPENAEEEPSNPPPVDTSLADAVADLEVQVADTLAQLNALVADLDAHIASVAAVHGIAQTSLLESLHSGNAFSGSGVGQLLVGYNPSHDRNPGNSHKWFNIDGVVKADAGTGNRAYFRSINLSNVHDPSEVVLLRAESNTSTNGYGDNDDGSDLLGVPQGVTLGFLVWYGAIASAVGDDPSFQGDSARIGVTTSEDVRQDFPAVVTNGSVTLPQATISITGNMDTTTADDGTVVPFEANGLVTLGGTESVRYAARTSTKLLGCSGGTGTFTSGSSVSQRQNRTGSRMSLKTSTIGSADSAERLRLDGLGSVRLGQRAMNTNAPTWFNIAGGPGRYEKLPDPTNLTATVVGTPGTTHYTYYVVGNDAYGGQTNDLSVNVTTGPATLTTTNYIKLEWVCPAGIYSFDVVRSASAGTPGTTGPIVLGQKVYAGQNDGAGGGNRYGLSACDTGLAVAGANEVQTIKLLDTDGGTFTLTFDGDTTTPLAYNASSATIQTAMEALGTIGGGNIAVADSSFLGKQYTFQGALAATNVSQITCDTSLLTNSGTDTPGVQARTRTEGAPSSYSTPARNTTADFQFDGAVGFYGTDPIARPAVTGSRGGNAALASLLTALEDLGLLHDNSTA